MLGKTTILLALAASALANPVFTFYYGGETGADTMPLDPAAAPLVAGAQQTVNTPTSAISGLAYATGFKVAFDAPTAGSTIWVRSSGGAGTGCGDATMGYGWAEWAADKYYPAPSAGCAITRVDYVVMDSPKPEIALDGSVVARKRRHLN